MFVLFVCLSVWWFREKKKTRERFVFFFYEGGRGPSSLSSVVVVRNRFDITHVRMYVHNERGISSIKEIWVK